MEKETEQPTQETHLEESQLNSASGAEAESVATDTSTTTDSLSLDEINKITGRDYKDKDSALKSIREWQSQAGKAADLEGKIKAAQADPKTPDEAVNALQEQLSSLNQKLEQSEAENFFNSNEEYSTNRALIEKLALADGVSFAEVVESDVYKSVTKEPEKRTVAASNNRQSATSKEFNPKDHAGDAKTLAKFVTENYILNK